MDKAHFLPRHANAKPLSSRLFKMPLHGTLALFGSGTACTESAYSVAGNNIAHSLATCPL